MIEVTKLSFPNLHAAFVAIEEDNGGHLIGTVYPGTPIDLSCFKVPDAWSALLPSAEVALLTLRQHSAEAFDDFLTGERTQQDRILAQRPDLASAKRVLADFFNGWQPEDAP